MASAPSADATSSLYSGGATSPAKVYRQIFNCYAQPVFGSTSPNSNEQNATTPFPSALPAQCSTTGSTTTLPYKAPFNATAAAVEFLYSPVGGIGLTAYTQESASALGNPSTSNPVAFTTTAFSAYPYPALDFVGSESALSTTQVAAIGPSNGLAAIQVPAFAVPYALPFNPGAGFHYPSNFTLNGGGSSKLRLSTKSVCGIFTGKVKNWSSSVLTADNGGVALAGNRPITVIVRSDSAGASYNFANWLVDNCAGTPYPVAAGFVASTTPNWPSTFVKANGSGGMANTVNSTQYSIGYVSPDYVKPVAPTGPVAANLIDPNGTPEPPTAAHANDALRNLTAPSASAGAYAWGQPLNDKLAQQSETATGYPTGGYPITSLTFLEFYQCYSASSPHYPQAAPELKYFLTDFLFSATNPAANEVLQILAANAFAQTSVAFRAAERQLVAAISWTGHIGQTEGSAACNASGVKGVNG